MVCRDCAGVYSNRLPVSGYTITQAAVTHWVCMRGSISSGFIIGLSVVAGVITTGSALLIQHNQWLDWRYAQMQAYYLSLSGFAFAPGLGLPIPVVSIGASSREDRVYEYRHQGISVSVDGGTIWLLDTPESIRYSVAVLESSPDDMNKRTARAITKRLLH